ncbi:hypothetical protein CDAR_289411 [Caerostris darwini]|uniref:Uncharacterized protein n=1 Tax=Caerostris darwini TaxID=1538125 RepID=A0AAV4WCM5_9ARAC|nr:hypothetical protein CDAR_289411 [Caerostris darwini]
MKVKYRTQDVRIECGCLGISQSCIREVIIRPKIGGMGGLGNALLGMTLCYRRSLNKRAGRLKVNTDQRVKSCNPSELKQRDPPPDRPPVPRYQTIIRLYQSEVQDVQIECGCWGISQSCMREVIIRPKIGGWVG